jgi:hypothetical protein
MCAFIVDFLYSDGGDRLPGRPAAAGCERREEDCDGKMWFPHGFVFFPKFRKKKLLNLHCGALFSDAS